MVHKSPLGVVFDIGGVLLDFDHMRACGALGQRCGMSSEDVYELVFTSGLEASYDRGMPTRDFFKECMRRLSTDIPFEKFGPLWSDIFREKPDVREIVEGLAGRTRLFILSNTNPLHYEFAVKKFTFLKEFFEASFLSFEIGETKPSPMVYRTVIEQTGLLPSELFYIDDHEEYAEAARSLGIPSVRFTTAGLLKEKLSELGLKV
jgi:putative hydrolase of the HAD superfamily